MAGTSLQAGFVQIDPILGQPEQTMACLERVFENISNPDLLVLPELCNSGYLFPDRETALNWAEPYDDSKFLRFLSTLCRHKGCHIVTGFHEKDGDDLFNSSVLVGPDGPMGRYRKIHLFLNEKDIFTPGNLGLPVFEIGDIKIGMLVCFDWIFPEVWRALALQDVDIICHPSNLVLPGFAQRAVPIHALLNHVYIITANRIGTEGDLTFTGLSTIADPKGNVLLQGSQDREEVGLVDIDVSVARDKWMTPRNHIFEDRRPGQYAPLIDTK